MADIRPSVPEKLERDLREGLEFVAQYMDAGSLKELRWSPHFDSVHADARMELRPELVVLDRDYNPERPPGSEHAEYEIASIPLERVMRLEVKGITDPDLGPMTFLVSVWDRDSSGTLRRFSPE